jgi:hypothetical protein
MNWVSRRRLFRCAMEEFHRGQQDSSGRPNPSQREGDYRRTAVRQIAYNDGRARPSERELSPAAWSQILAEAQRP